MNNGRYELDFSKPTKEINIHRSNIIRADTTRPKSRHFLLLTTLVIACRITIPARSTSFLDKPVVMHTLSAGCTSHPASLEVPLTARGMLLTRAISTPFASVYHW